MLPHGKAVFKFLPDTSISTYRIPLRVFDQPLDNQQPSPTSHVLVTFGAYMSQQMVGDENYIVGSEANKHDTVKSTKQLSDQYGGTRADVWVNLLPASWAPYIQLARLSPPVAVFLIYFQHIFGALHAANTHGVATLQLLRALVALLGGSFFFSNAAHAWNDIVDAPIDRRVSRTKGRPIAIGAIPPKAAFIFATSQALAAASFLLLSNTSTAKATIPTIVGTTYYPWAKLHTYFPQVILGFCLAWGIIVSSGFVGMDKPWNDKAALCLVLASTLWTVIYDPIYAHQDLADDVNIGVKSTAIFFGKYVKVLLWIILVVMGTSLMVHGQLMEMGIAYYIITLGGCMSSLGAMITNVELKNELYKRDSIMTLHHSKWILDDTI